MSEALERGAPEGAFSFSQPIEMRMSELISGVRADIAIKLFGDDLEVLRRTAERIAEVVGRVPGAEGVKVEQVAGLPQLQITPHREAIARDGANIEDVNDLVESISAEQGAGLVYRGEQRFGLAVKLDEAAGAAGETIRNLVLDTPSGARVPLSQLATIEVVEGPAQISREDTRRRIAIEMNVRARDIGSFVAEAQQTLASNVPAEPSPEGPVRPRQPRMVVISCLCQHAVRRLRFACDTLTDMGMTGGLYRASAEEIRKLVEEPTAIDAFFEASTWAPPVREVRPKGMLGWLMKLSPVQVFETDPGVAPPLELPPDRPHCDLEGVWHGLHFLFTGTAWEGDEPACYLILGGEAIGDPDELGYSVLHALGPDKVRRFAAFVRGLSREELERRFDPARMTELAIDPEHWNHAARGRRPLDELLAGYDALRAFVDETADAKAGAVVYVA